MKRRRMKILGGAACLAALAAVAVIALPASGTAPPGQAFFAKLDGAHEVGPGTNDLDGYGTFSGGLATVSGVPKLCAGFAVFKIGTVTGAHIHKAPVGQSGSIVVNLTPASGTPGNPGAFHKCVTITTTLFNQIKASPGAYYANVHTSAFPNGAIRGQLFQANATQDK